MKFYNDKRQLVKSKEADKFLSDFLLLCKKYKLCLIPEKNHMVITDYDVREIKKLLSHLVLKKYDKEESI